ncbi:hypothetical protein BGX12_10579 [Fibrobacter sp. UWR4]|uniref:hypothetical protein n=1 Tax=Fibrobacter sp. UWR4 TaxID=1896218 RepID=UPI000D6C0C18|nr:hypothetical protein [Fibrobacter sp. UWR4]PWJ69115.1 hypothetical protein BGX12_10579 [Fibrobacter sp. UWR4]
MTKTYTILGIVVAIILGVYNYLPDQRFLDEAFPVGEGVSVIGYDDQYDGGSSQIEFDAGDSTLDFSCTLGPEDAKAGWCGVLFQLGDVADKKFKKWNFVDTVHLDIESSGTNEILLKIWTFDPDVTQLDKPNTFRLLLKEVALKGGRETIAIPMDDFYTPEFWFEEYGKESARNRRSLESAARVEITSGWNQPRGQKYTIKLRQLSVSGVSNLYFGITLGLIVLVVIAAIGLRHPRRNAEGRHEP